MLPKPGGGLRRRPHQAKLVSHCPKQAGVGKDGPPPSPFSPPAKHTNPLGLRVQRSVEPRKSLPNPRRPLPDAFLAQLRRCAEWLRADVIVTWEQRIGELVFNRATCEHVCGVRWMPERQGVPSQEAGPRPGSFPLESFEEVSRLAREVLRERGLSEEQIGRELQRAMRDET
jgi:hypothetical protein